MLRHTKVYLTMSPPLLHVWAVEEGLNSPIKGAVGSNSGVDARDCTKNPLKVLIVASRETV